MTIIEKAKDVLERYDGMSNPDCGNSAPDDSELARTIRELVVLVEALFGAVSHPNN
jgi:hypothetical protein